MLCLFYKVSLFVAMSDLHILIRSEEKKDVFLTMSAKATCSYTEWYSRIFVERILYSSCNCSSFRYVLITVMHIQFH